MLHSTRDNKHPIVDDPPCFESTLESFEKHCGVIIKNDMKQSVENLCKYIVKKEAIHEAIILACGVQSPKSHVIDVANPEIDITPAPMHGSFEYCGRVSINGISKTKLENHANTYQVTVLPKSISEGWDYMIRICLHGNDSLGPCQCEKDDWKSIENGSWSSVLPPFEKIYVDVKFVAKISGSVTVLLNEVPRAHGCCNGLLVAVGSCLALGYVITSLLSPLLSKKTKLGPHGLGQGSLGSQLTQQAIADFSSRDFKAWMIKNAHRIKILPDNK